MALFERSAGPTRLREGKKSVATDSGVDVASEGAVVRRRSWRGVCRSYVPREAPRREGVEGTSLGNWVWAAALT
jgi:hypothetical protein